MKKRIGKIALLMAVCSFMIFSFVFNLFIFDSMQITEHSVTTFATSLNVNSGFDFEEWEDENNSKDVDGDGEIDARDLAETKKCLIATVNEGEEPPEADTNCDGETNILDLIYLKRYLVEKNILF